MASKQPIHLPSIHFTFVFHVPSFRNYTFYPITLSPVLWKKHLVSFIGALTTVKNSEDVSNIQRNSVLLIIRSCQNQHRFPRLNFRQRISNVQRSVIHRRQILFGSLDALHAYRIGMLHAYSTGTYLSQKTSVKTSPWQPILQFWRRKPVRTILTYLTATSEYCFDPVATAHLSTHMRPIIWLDIVIFLIWNWISIVPNCRSLGKRGASWEI